MKNENPVDHVKFYDKNLNNGQYTHSHIVFYLLRYFIFILYVFIVFKLEKSQVSYLVPEHFEELSIRIFTKDRKKVNLFVIY
jgi:hypothetical protein